MGAAHALAFINHDAHPGKGFQDVFFGAGHEAVLVGVLDAQEHLAAQLAGQQVVVQRRAHAANVQRPGGGWCEAHPNFSLSHATKVRTHSADFGYFLFAPRVQVGRAVFHGVNGQRVQRPRLVKE